MNTGLPASVPSMVLTHFLALGFDIKTVVTIQNICSLLRRRCGSHRVQGAAYLSGIRRRKVGTREADFWLLKLGTTPNPNSIRMSGAPHLCLLNMRVL
jgi:hypothetical protein